MKPKTFNHNTILFALMFFLNSCSSGPSLDSIDYEKEFDVDAVKAKKSSAPALAQT